MIIVKTDTPQERHEVIDKALADGCYVLVSIAGAMVIGSKELAVTLFGRLASGVASMGEDDTIPIMSVLDDRRMTCVGFACATPAAVFLYGVPDSEITELLKQTNTEACITEITPINPDGFAKGRAN